MKHADKKLKNMDWTILSSEYLMRRPWMTVRRDCVQLPDGRKNDEYYVLEYPDWVNVIAETTDHKLLLIRQYRHGLGRTCFEIPAGVIEQGESPLEAAQRELLEETGFAGGEWEEIMTVSPNASATNNLSHSFVAHGVRQVAAQSLDATEDIEVYMFSEAEVKEMLLQGCFMQALMVAPLYKFLFASK